MNPNEIPQEVGEAALPLTPEEKAGLTHEQLRALFKVYFDINSKQGFQPQSPGSEGAQEIHDALQAKLEEFKQQPE